MDSCLYSSHQAKVKISCRAKLCSIKKQKKSYKQMQCPLPKREFWNIKLWNGWKCEYISGTCKFHSHAIELMMWHCKEVLAMSRELKGQKQLWGVWPSSRGPEFGRHLLFAATWSPLGNPAQPSGPRWLQCNPPIRQFLVQLILSVQALATTSKCELARKCWTEASTYSGGGRVRENNRKYYKSRKRINAMLMFSQFA